MTINATAPYQTTPVYAKSTAVKTAAVGERVFNVPEAVAAKQIDSSTVYKGLSSKYDVRNATFEEIVEISNALHAAGEISLQEHGVLTFDFGRATEYLKRNAPGYVSPQFDMYETSVNSNGQRDWITEFEARASSHFKYGNLVGYQTNSKIHLIMQKLDTKYS